MPMNPVKKGSPSVPPVYGFYSPSADVWSGHCIYVNSVGQRVKVTEVRTGVNEPSSLHTDIVAVGRVVRFISNSNLGKYTSKYNP